MYLIEREDEDHNTTEVGRFTDFDDVLKCLEQSIGADDGADYFVCKVETVERRLYVTDGDLDAIIEVENATRRKLKEQF